jgi:hypothetical protein
MRGQLLPFAIDARTQFLAPMLGREFVEKSDRSQTCKANQYDREGVHA